jgi:(1->4)-alpha-D-glucan 1-alpha-D-glucosylmutase
VPDGWPVAGTTGYDALREVCGVFIDRSGAAHFPARTPFVDAATDGKREAATALLATELTRLVGLAPEVPKAREALADVATRLDVYRTYLPVGREHLDAALAATAASYPDAVAALAGDLTAPASELAQRFQQYTGAVMAKGVEDTAFYRWTRFVALNEVGGAPDRFGASPEEFHAAAMRRVRLWPHGMTALSTHDTKRSEDVRARLAVLAEVGPQWQAALSAWTAAAPLGDPDFADLMWQTVVGAWPIDDERLRAYFHKAAREAATHTTWTDPDPAFEHAIDAVVDAMYGPLRGSIDDFVGTIREAGWSNSLGQKLVQLTMPGVPDTYQGTELWDNSLVDPDNRRPVDFAARSALLERIDGGWLPPVDDSGAAKLLVTTAALRLRRDRPTLFLDYQPMVATGGHASHVLAFDRGGAVTAVTRLPIGLADDGGWRDDDVLAVHAGAWRDVMTGNRFHGASVPVRALFATLPVALLVADDGTTR